jgi:hypothetical protein
VEGVGKDGTFRREFSPPLARISVQARISICFSRKCGATGSPFTAWQEWSHGLCSPWDCLYASQGTATARVGCCPRARFLKAPAAMRLVDVVGHHAEQQDKTAPFFCAECCVEGGQEPERNSLRRSERSFLLECGCTKLQGG